MNKKNFNDLSSFLSIKKVEEKTAPSIYENVNDLSKSFESLRETISDAGESIKNLYRARMDFLDMLNDRLNTINAFAKTPAFAELLKTNPAAVQKLADEVQYLVKQSHSI